MTTREMPLSELVEIFKGKAVPAKAEPGNVAVINLGDMLPLGIDYEHLKTFSGEEKALSRYLLSEGDILLASKGTQHKVAVFEAQDRAVVASANITVLRPKVAIQSFYLKFFLDSKEGRKQLKAADHGRAVMNISTKELSSINIPIIPKIKQDFLAQRYLQGLADYKRKLARANQEWQRVQTEIERQLFG
ncbi:restriction endonuclease subunit S [Streptococcus sp. zg-JUN1979]|uniref:restriction endonuclease subunit S n=1 Tax=Streptococcus sp. zg-JUN1979 TaxID=3391450 RepID=UPI0039A78110